MNALPDQKSIKVVLSSKKRFIIPRFQREYSWDKQNYSEFFNDILYNIKFDKTKIKSTQYFLGTMLFIGDFNDGNLKNMDVIDGQQRLTNITILLSALSKRFQEINEEKLASNLFKYIVAENDDGNEIRILNTITSHPYFSFYVQEMDKKHASEEAKSEEEKLIKETFDFFYNKLNVTIINDINKYFNIQLKKENYLKVLQAIRDQILNSTIIAITTKDKKEGKQIFEILNAKGKKLSFVDLIKNKIFGELNSLNENDFAIKKWDEIKSILSNSKANIGIATFLLHYWASKYGRCTADKLYDDFKKKIKKKEYEIFLMDLLYEANNYVKIVSPSREQYNNRKEKFALVQSLDAISNKFDIRQTRVLFLSLFYMKDKKYINTKLFNETINYIENFHFAYNAIASLKTNKLNNIYSNFSLKARNIKNNIDAEKLIKNDLIKKLDKIFPKYREFEKRFIKLKYSKKDIPTNCKTKYAINKINSYYSDKELFADDGSIEHIINEDIKDQNTLLIGNLLLLEEKINNKFSTNIYKEKIKEYKKSKYKWVEEFLNENQTFDKKSIQNRSKKLAKLYYTRILNK